MDYLDPFDTNNPPKKFLLLLPGASPAFLKRGYSTRIWYNLRDGVACLRLAQQVILAHNLLAF